MITEKDKAAITKALQKKEDEALRLIAANYRQALKEIRNELTQVYEKYAIDGKLTYAEMSKYNRLTKLEAEILKEINGMYNDNAKVILRLGPEIYQESFYRHHWGISRAYGIDVNFGLLRPEQVREAVRNPMTKISLDGIKGEGLTGIRRTIMQGLIQGKSYTKMSKSITEFAERTAAGYERIVRTEGQRAAVKGNQAVSQDLRNRGFEIDEVWLATLDGATRQEKQSLDNTTATMRGGKAQWFIPGTGWVDGPVQTGVAALDINCRCDSFAEIREFPDKYRRQRDEGIIQNVPYPVWKALHDSK